MGQVIAVQGTDLVNKGAELMLLAIVQKLQEKGFIVAADLRCGNFHQRNEMGIYHLPWFFFGKIPGKLTIMLQNALNVLFQAIPQKLRQSAYLFTEEEIDAVLDASGFGYSDQHGKSGIHKAQIAAHNIRKWKKAGKKVIFLPQAFGPFRHSNMKNDMSQVLANADLLFARDDISFAYLAELSDDEEIKKIKLAPDFTCLIQGSVPDYFSFENKRACLIPNNRMIDRTESGTGEKYLSFLTNCLAYLVEKECKPFILIHEDHDLPLAKDLQSIFPSQVDIIQESNPLYVKGILGNCSFLISSRYHGLVSALSQNVPCLATGWSHKYEMLLADYDCPECLLDVFGTRDEIIQKVDMIRQGESRENLIQRLQAAGAEQRGLALAMWKDVFAVLLQVS